MKVGTISRYGPYVCPHVLPSQSPPPLVVFVKFLRRLENRREIVLDVLRVYLGAGLLFRGLALLAPNTGLQQLAGGTMPDVSLTLITVYVTAAHLVGGALMIVGLYTRVAALVQLPILVGAVFLIHWRDGLLSANQSLEFSVLVLYLLVIVCIFGGGRWSLDARWWGQTSGSPEQPARSTT